MDTIDEQAPQDGANDESKTTVSSTANNITNPANEAQIKVHQGDPMTTRKKLSHLRAHIKRQAAKAARSRLDKRSSSVSVSTSAATPPTSANAKTLPTSTGHSSHCSHDGTSSRVGVGEQLGNIKQKLVALIKKFRTDGTDFDSEEQYRETLERELMKAAAVQGPKAIEELLDEEIDGVEGDSGSEPDSWDNISETSTPKPSLRPFFSSTTLDKI